MPFSVIFNIFADANNRSGCFNISTDPVKTHVEDQKYDNFNAKNVFDNAMKILIQDANYGM